MKSRKPLIYVSTAVLAAILVVSVVTACGTLKKVQPGADTKSSNTVASSTAVGTADRIPQGKGKTIKVSTVAELNSAISEISEGDTLVLADGSYGEAINAISGKNGTSSNPIIIKAENINKANITENGSFKISNSSYIIVEGIKFTSKDRTALQLSGCNNVRVTRCHFNLTQTNKDKDLKYVLIDGMKSNRNRVDHCLFEEKHGMGQMLAIHGYGDQVSQYDLVDHNYFKNNGPRIENGQETIRIGLSGLSMSSGFTTIEYNYFENCDGDPEYISNKSCDNTIRYNTFKNCQGQLVFRHGNRSAAYGNFIIGDGVKQDVAGIRVHGSDHKVYNNYMEKLTGSAITLERGNHDQGPDNKNYTKDVLTKHWRVYRAEVTNNTIVNCASGLNITPYEKNIFSAVECKIANNIIMGPATKLFNEAKAPEKTVYEGNIVWSAESDKINTRKAPGEFKVMNPQLESNGIYRLSKASPAIDAAVGNYTYVTEDIDGQKRNKNDIGADEFSTEPVKNIPLKPEDVGINAK